MLIVVDEDRIAFLVKVVFWEGAVCLDIWDLPKRFACMLERWKPLPVFLLL